jgi:hypothetical protein
MRTIMRQTLVWTSLCLAILTTARHAAAQPLGTEKPDPITVATAALIEAHDDNGDKKLNADECPTILRDRFSLIDVNHDGYLVHGEISVALARRSIVPGKVVAQELYIITDGVVAEIHHNGKPVPLNARGIMKEVDGATAERVDLFVHEGDWLVFHVATNPLRRERGGYFAVAGERPGSPGFASNLTTGGWLANDDPSEAARFIDDPNTGFQPVVPFENQWAGGDALMEAVLHHRWTGSAVWGKAPSTWIKYVAPAPTKPAGRPDG